MVIFKKVLKVNALTTEVTVYRLFQLLCYFVALQLLVKPLYEKSRQDNGHVEDASIKTSHCVRYLNNAMRTCGQ